MNEHHDLYQWSSHLAPPKQTIILLGQTSLISEAVKNIHFPMCEELFKDDYKIFWQLKLTKYLLLFLMRHHSNLT